MSAKGVAQLVDKPFQQICFRVSPQVFHIQRTTLRSRGVLNVQKTQVRRMGKDLFAELCGDPGVICQVQADQVRQLGQGRVVDVFVELTLSDTETEIENGKMGLSQRFQTGNCCAGTEGEITQCRE